MYKLVSCEYETTKLTKKYNNFNILLIILMSVLTRNESYGKIINTDIILFIDITGIIVYGNTNRDTKLTHLWCTRILVNRFVFSWWYISRFPSRISINDGRHIIFIHIIDRIHSRNGVKFSLSENINLRCLNNTTYMPWLLKNFGLVHKIRNTLYRFA